MFYGDFQALFGVSMSDGAGRRDRARRRQRGGQDARCCARSPGAGPSAGAVRYGGSDITAAPPHRRIARGIALVPEGRKLFPSLTVEENIQVGAAAAASDAWPLDAHLRAFPMIARAAQAARVHAVRRRAAGGGDRAGAGRGAVRCCCSTRSRSAWRRSWSRGFYETLSGLRSAGATLVLVEQDLRRAMDACDDLVCLLEGRVALAAPVADVTRDQVVAAYFGEGPAVTWVNAVIQGMLLGGQYALIACGLSLTFGVMRIVNLAHGDLAVCGAYLGLVLSSPRSGCRSWVTLPLLLPAAFAAGMALQLLLFGRALRHGVARAGAGHVRAVGHDREPAAGGRDLRPARADRRAPGAGQLPHLGGITVSWLFLTAFLTACAVLSGLQLLLSPHLLGPQGARHRRRPGHRAAGGHPGAAGVRDRGGHRDRHRGPGGRLHRHDRHLRPADRHATS